MQRKIKQIKGSDKKKQIAVEAGLYMNEFQYKIYGSITK